MKVRFISLFTLLFICCSYCLSQEQCPKMFPNRISGILRKNISYNDAINSAKNTYAVIINSGKDLKSNREAYWNDCSFFYKTLRNVYNVLQNNIYVVMSDGTDPGLDITLECGDEMSSPLDLDGDGIDDIQYAATKDNIKNIFVKLSQILTDKDQLIVFVVGHGGIDTESYICLWNSNNNLYSSEMADYIKDINAGYITLIFGQCYSGGFVKSLKAENRLVISACRENEKSWTRPDIAYDEFVSMFTSALANVDIFDETVDADYNNDGTVTLLEAYRYAEENDGYNDGDFSFGNVREHPQVSYLHGSNVEDLSLSHIPNSVELSFADDPLLQTRVSWDTEAIILGQGTNTIDWTNDNSNFSENSSKVASVKIRNRGVKPCKAFAAQGNICYS